jgi:NTE family protein
MNLSYPPSIGLPKANGSDVVHEPAVALCLSGGGYRAALFHLGALRRLNEVGALSYVNLVSTVSGGSILAGHLATYLSPWPPAGESFTDWNRLEEAFRRFVKHDIRTWPVLKRLLFPWNWLRPSTQVRALERIYEQKLTPLKLRDLPDRPAFIFCATDLVHGVSWVFEKNRVGSYKAGYLTAVGDWPVARAVAASSCFPPVFDPMPIRTSDHAVATCLSDGGLYDNLGLEPASRLSTVFVSDGGAPFIATVPRGLFGRLKTYLNVMGRQAGALRRRYLIADFKRSERAGTYWGIDSAPERYVKDLPQEQRHSIPVGYSKSLATARIASIRTDLDAFSDAEIAVLENHGYCLADIALRAHAPSLITIHAPFVPPHPDWMDEGVVFEVLRHSSKRSRLARWLCRTFQRAPQDHSKSATNE